MATELEDYLDREFAAVIEKALEQFSELDPIVRSGTIAGFLIKTGMAIAAKHGAPRRAVLAGFQDALREIYNETPKAPAMDPVERILADAERDKRKP